MLHRTITAALFIASAALALSPASAEAGTFTYRGLTSGEYQTMFDTLTPQGYRPVQMQGHGGSSARFDVQFKDIRGGAWVARHNLNSEQFKAASAVYSVQGYRITLYSAYRVNGTLLHMALWEMN